MTMQMLVLAAQNAAPRRDMAVGTFGVTLLPQSSAGAVGVARLRGDPLPTRSRTNWLARLGGVGGAPALGTLKAIHGLPPQVVKAQQESYTEAMPTVILVGVPTAVFSA